MWSLVVREKKRKHIFDVKFINSIRKGKHEPPIYGIYTPKPPNQLFQNLIGNGYGPSRDKKAAIFLLSCSLSSVESSVLSVDLAWPEKILSSDVRNCGFNEDNWMRPFIPRA